MPWMSPELRICDGISEDFLVLFPSHCVYNWSGSFIALSLVIPCLSPVFRLDHLVVAIRAALRLALCLGLLCNTRYCANVSFSRWDPLLSVMLLFQRCDRAFSSVSMIVLLTTTCKLSAPTYVCGGVCVWSCICTTVWYVSLWYPHLRASCLKSRAMRYKRMQPSPCLHREESFSSQEL